MSYHYYCWALGYSSDQEFDPALRLVCDDVGVVVFCCQCQHRALGVGTDGVQHSGGAGGGAGGQRPHAHGVRDVLA